MYRLLLLLLILSFACINKSLSQVSIVADLYPGKKGSNPYNITAYRGKPYFYATTPTDGQQVWTLDNSYMPKMVQKLRPWLWKYYGTDFQMQPSYKSMVVSNNILYLSANDTFFGSELWQYNGSTMTMLADINTDNTMSNFTAGSSEIRHIAAVAGALYFNAWTGPEVHELWRYDINKKEAKQILSLPGQRCVNPYFNTPMMDDMYFSGMIDTGAMAAGHHLIRHKAGTTVFKDVDNAGSFPSQAMSLYVGYDKLYYSGKYGGQYNLYVFDESTNTSKQITNFAKSHSAFSLIRRIAAYKGAIYYAGEDGLYKIDTGTYQVTLIESLSGLYDLTLFKDKLVFGASDTAHGIELWSYDGATSPVMITDINIGKGNSQPGDFTPIGDTLYFSAQDTMFNRELYRYIEPKPNTIEGVQAQTKFNIYPNPTDGHISIDLGKVYDNASVEVISMLGQKMFAKTFQAVAGMEIDIEAPAGMYLVHIKAGEEEYTSMKILKTD